MFTPQEVQFLLGLYEKNTSCVVCAREFEEDISKFEEIVRLLKTYRKKGVINLRYILNTFIILENVFGPVAIGLMISKCPNEFRAILFSVLEYAGRLPFHLRKDVDRTILEEIRRL